MRRRRAFTLVELLVVVAIITILIAILLPILMRAKRQAQKVICQANLRTIGAGLMMYVEDHKYYPGGWINTGPPGAAYLQGGPVAVWPTLIRKYLGSRKPFYCPARDAKFMWTDPPSEPRVLPKPSQQVAFGYGATEYVIYSTMDGQPRYSVPWSYAYNFCGAGGIRNPVDLHIQRGLGWLVEDSGLPLVKATMVKKPGEMIAIADSSGEFGNIAMAAAEWRAFMPEASGRGPGNIHQGGANVLFCDGHVEWYLQKDLIVADWQNGREPIRRYWNNDNEP